MSDLEKIANAIRNATDNFDRQIVQIPDEPTVEDLCAAIASIAEWGCAADEIWRGFEL